ncbi:MAG: hypothetical protein AAFY88_21980, partial [Acidobacteriota bacterium]
MQREFLSEACGEDTALLQEVEELLAFDRASHAGLDRITWGEPTGVAEAEVRAAGPSRLGSYELLELIGEGGMGRVYRARRQDGRFERDVAIKILKDGILDRETLGLGGNVHDLLVDDGTLWVATGFGL